MTGELAALGGVLRRWNCRGSLGRRCFRGSQGGDGIEQPAPVSDQLYAEVLQVFVREAGKNASVDLVFSECRLVVFEPKASQPTFEIHRRQLHPAAHDHSWNSNCPGLAAREIWGLAGITPSLGRERNGDWRLTASASA